MNDNTKESKFLSAINRYAEKQKALISAEVEEYKAQKIEQATESGLQDAYDLIQREIAARKRAIVTEYAQKEYALRRELYNDRQQMTDEVFAAAAEQIIAFTSTPAYRESFARSAAEAARICGDSPCVLYVCERDRALANDSLKLFYEAVLEIDPAITLGGFKVMCARKGVLIDSTLDTKLLQERQRFTEYCGLKVVE